METEAPATGRPGERLDEVIDLIRTRVPADQAELLAGSDRDVELLALGLLRLPGLRAASRSKLAWALEALGTLADPSGAD